MSYRKWQEPIWNYRVRGCSNLLFFTCFSVNSTQSEPDCDKLVYRKYERVMKYLQILVENPEMKI